MKKMENPILQKKAKELEILKVNIQIVLKQYMKKCSSLVIREIQI